MLSKKFVLFIFLVFALQNIVDAGYDDYYYDITDDDYRFITVSFWTKLNRQPTLLCIGTIIAKRGILVTVECASELRKHILVYLKCYNQKFRKYSEENVIREIRNLREGSKFNVVFIKEDLETSKVIKVDKLYTDEFHKRKFKGVLIGWKSTQPEFNAVEASIGKDIEIIMITNELKLNEFAIGSILVTDHRIVAMSYSQEDKKILFHEVKSDDLSVIEKHDERDNYYYLTISFWEEYGGTRNLLCLGVLITEDSILITEHCRSLMYNLRSIYLMHGNEPIHSVTNEPIIIEIKKLRERSFFKIVTIRNHLQIKSDVKVNFVRNSDLDNFKYNGSLIGWKLNKGPFKAAVEVTYHKGIRIKMLEQGVNLEDIPTGGFLLYGKDISAIYCGLISGNPLFLKIECDDFEEIKKIYETRDNRIQNCNVNKKRRKI